MKVRRGFMIRFLSVCLPVFLSAVPAVAFDAAEVSRACMKALKADEPLPIVDVASEDKTEANAYRVQALLVEALLTENGDSVAGYKAGVTAPAQMQRFGAPGPASAPLFKSGLIEAFDPTTAVKLVPFKGMMLETEFAFKTAKPITAPVKNEAELKTMIAGVHPAVEVPQVFFADMARVKFFDLTAAAIGSKRFVIGPSQPTDGDFDAMKVVLTHNGTVVNEGTGSEALGSQWKALLWLVNNVLANGGKIEAGQYFMTGALGKMIPAAPGGYRAEYPFGTLVLVVEGK